MRVLLEDNLVARLHGYSAHLGQVMRRSSRKADLVAAVLNCVKHVFPTQGKEPWVLEVADIATRGKELVLLRANAVANDAEFCIEEMEALNGWVMRDRSAVLSEFPERELRRFRLPQKLQSSFQ